MFSELNNLYCVQYVNLGGKLHLLDLLMKYEKWAEYWLKNSEHWVMQVQVMLFLNQYVSLLALHHYYPFQSVSRMFIISIHCTQHYREPSSTLMSLKTIIINPSLKGLKTNLPFVTCNHRGLLYFNLIYLSVCYFTFIYFILDLKSLTIIFNFLSFVFHVIT